MTAARGSHSTISRGVENVPLRRVYGTERQHPSTPSHMRTRALPCGPLPDGCLRTDITGAWRPSHRSAAKTTVSGETPLSREEVAFPVPAAQCLLRLTPSPGTTGVLSSPCKQRPPCFSLGSAAPTLPVWRALCAAPAPERLSLRGPTHLGAGMPASLSALPRRTRRSLSREPCAPPPARLCFSACR